MRNLVVLCAVLAGPPSGAPAAAPPGVCESDSGADAGADVCGLEPGDPTGAPAPLPASERPSLLFFWGVGCPHCEEARPFVDELARAQPDLSIERIEVRRDASGRRRFIETMRRLGAQAAGIPTFVVGERWIVGFARGSTEAEVRRAIEAARRGTAATADTRLQVPLIGEVDARTMPLAGFTLAIGLLDGINPCAMWVLLVLLGILGHVRSRGRLFLFGGAFVAMSGIVYFAFMTAWSAFFQLAGLSRAITMGLGALVLVMGLVNLKELVWFKRGVSLTIPDRAKPGLFRRMRAISRAASLPVALFGILILAFLVNLIELGCTLGLPAVYTRILSLRGELSAAGRFGYLALYNLAYVVPLAAIVLVYAMTLHRLALGERGAKVLKGVSGVLLVGSGLLLLFRPELLG